MKIAKFIDKGQMEVVEANKPTLMADDDVILKVVRTCVCGSDLWAFNGHEDLPEGLTNGGHEALGIVEEVGAGITTVKPGDFVIAPFTHGCGHCAACEAGYDGNCQDHAINFSGDCQAEYVRYSHAEWSLIKVPGQPEDYSEGMLKSLLSLADVMATGYHAARVAEVKPGDSALVIGDGAVGLCGVISAKLRGASQIILMSHHEDRAELGKEFGATHIITERGDEAVQKVMELTNNRGADAVLECVGNESAQDQALAAIRPGGFIGRVGLPHGQNIDSGFTFRNNIHVAGGPASVSTYDKEVLLKAVLDGKINPGKVFNKTYKLDEIDEAYHDMADRKVLKAYITID